MSQRVDYTIYGGTLAENYQRYFVPTIGAPVAEDLIAVADIGTGERVLDVACGTGVVTRLAAERAGSAGRVAGLDANPGMLAVARSETPSDLPVDWHEANAEEIPLPDDSFDVVLCQMGLQFMANKLGALREMRRVLVPGGRVLVTVPGPKPDVFTAMTNALSRHFGPEVASFGDLVFSMHDVEELSGLMHSSGFRDVDVTAKPKRLGLPEPADFLWQYIYSTPMAEPVSRADAATRDALERDFCAQWDALSADGPVTLRVGVTTAMAKK